MAVDVRAGVSKFEVGTPNVLFQASSVNYGYDVTGDGRRFLVNVPVEKSSSDPATVMLNWTSALKK